MTKEQIINTKGNNVDFYLEDDMFEIEGVLYSNEDRLIIDVKNAVGHILSMAGKNLEIYDEGRKLYAKRIDTGKIFEIEINRIYDLLENPTPIDFTQYGNVEYFFKKEEDTLVWSDNEKWHIELNKINMYFSGERRTYGTLSEMFENEDLSGTWQAVNFSSQVDEDLGNSQAIEG